MAEKKLTKRDYFNQLLAIEEVKNDEKLVGFINHELELLAKKNASGDKKATATQIANENIKNEILEEMAKEPNKLFSVSEMIKSFDCCKELSLPKVTALVTQLTKADLVVRVEEKRKAYFKIA